MKQGIVILSLFLHLLSKNAATLPILPCYKWISNDCIPGAWLGVYTRYMLNSGDDDGDSSGGDYSNVGRGQKPRQW